MTAFSLDDHDVRHPGPSVHPQFLCRSPRATGALGYCLNICSCLSRAYRASFATGTTTLASTLWSSVPDTWRSAKYHASTALLFTIADIKTIFLPITAFACATAPLHSYIRLLAGMSWVWLHQLMCNVSNQARSRAEDAQNKPWRPLPAGRITERQAIRLRWAIVLLCLCYSTIHGMDLAIVTLGLLTTTFLYDEVGLSGHYIGKNLCNIGGYTSLELGTTKLMGSTRAVDRVSATAICISGLVIFTTIHAQDFADVVGDSALGRRTFPIVAPRLSRTVTLLSMTAWSLFLAWFWGIGPFSSCVFVALGVVIAGRYYRLRNPAADKLSYVLYNAWLTLAHIMPIHARTGVFIL